ncbi:protein translocase SEC61 complex subunit gamma [Candidatus Micrarchaeota archaeon]|nr:protein translocase SEC61 complex subunit gamma [Candidatus Micrarchaeota archaeon]
MEFAELVKRCIRIIYISRKPTPAEYAKVAKVTATGMLLFGLTGFIISMISNLVNTLMVG